MNAPMLRRLVWKELRTTASLWVAMVGLCLVMDAFVAVQRTTSFLTSDVKVAWYYSIALTVAALYALACSGMQFALEHENGTFSLLRSLPLAARDVFWTKTAWTAASATLLGVVLVGMTFLATGGRPMPSERLAVYGMFLLEGLVWGTLFSLAGSRVMTSLFRTGIAIALSVGTLASLYAWLSNTPFYGDNIVRIYTAIWPYRLLIVVVVAAVDVRLGLRWFDHWKFGGRREPSADGFADTLAGRWRMPYRASRSELGHLCRHHLRQSRAVLGFFLVLVLPWFFVGLLTAAGLLHKSSDSVGLVLAGPLLGAIIYPSLAFYADQRRRHYRFLAHHGVTARRAWWSRQLVWAACYGLLVGLCIAAFFVKHQTSPPELWHLMKKEPGAYAVTLVFATLLLGSYACGTLVSILMRSTILAVALGAGLSVGLAMLLGFLAWYLGWMPVGVILLGLLAAGRMHAGDWLVERRTWASRARWLVPAVAPFLLVAALTPTIRIHQYPEVSDPGFSPSQLRAEACSPEGVAQLAELVAIHDMPRLTVTLQPDPDVEGAEPTQRDILSDEAFQRLVAFYDAGPKPGPYFEEPWTDSWASLEPKGRGTLPVFVLSELRWLMHHTATYYQQQGRLAEALDGLVAQARPSVSLLLGGGYEDLRGWARHEGMTPELLREAIGRLDELSPQRVDYTLGFKLHYLVTERMIADDTYYAQSSWRNDSSRWRRAHLDSWWPWERTRALRRLRYVWRDESDRARRTVDSLCNPDAPPLEIEPPPRIWHGGQENTYQEYFLGFDVWWMWWRWDSLELGILKAETRRRVAQTELAVELWRLEHDGALPKALEQLVPEYLEQLPVDPASKKPLRLVLDPKKEYVITE